ncbi:hypothetical protein [Falsirhodobacter deserti]|uniref:hypothetical protein n=1 Tax=Falsirhodobacter deserti TaxID=1365611 RepID=UPI000FE43EC2|nr:hypothetical protein [Falsirhodobacter deserti]
MTAPKFRIVEAGAAIRPSTSGTSAGPAAYAFVNIEMEGGGIATGRGCGHLRSQPDPCLGNTSIHPLARVAEAYVSFKHRDTAFGHHVDRTRSLMSGRFHENRPALWISLGCRIFDAAVLDALLLFHGLNFSRGMQLNISGITASGARALDVVAGVHQPRMATRASSMLMLKALARHPNGLAPQREAVVQHNAVELWAGGHENEHALDVLPISSSSRAPADGTDLDIYGTLLGAPMTECLAACGVRMDSLAAKQDEALRSYLNTPAGSERHQQGRGSVKASLSAPGFGSQGVPTPADLEWC